MSEETEGQDTGAEAVAGGVAGVDPIAAALALGGASREEADAFLKDQRAVLAKQGALIDDQRHHLHEQFKHLHLSVWEKQLGVLLRVATVAMGLAIAAGLGFLVWSAAHAEGLIIQPFSVPPDLASRGITGQMVASQLLDKLTSMQNLTTSMRSPKSYSNNWGDDLKVAIPDTGVSAGEAYRFLCGWLGHETQISGEVYRTANGIAITVRTSGDAGATYAGPESSLDTLVQESAEHVYGHTQPQRYATLLRNTERRDEAQSIFNQMIAGPSPQEQAWAWTGIAGLYSTVGNVRAAIAPYERAIAAYPDFTAGYYYLALFQHGLGHNEASLAAALKTRQLLNRGSIPDIDPKRLAGVRLNNDQTIAFLSGDYVNVVSLSRTRTELQAVGGFFMPEIADALALQHDGKGARTYLNNLPSPQTPPGIGNRAAKRFLADVELGNWQAARASEPIVEKLLANMFRDFDPNAILGTQIRPFLALAKAKLGDIAGAETLIATTPGDCDDCIRIRGIIASEAKQYGRADYWFARAVQQAPSFPFAYADWGQSLLARGQPDAAIAKFTLANQKSPHFADPLEMWGEALMAKNQSHLALAKFKEAKKYAPNWGRLHMKWGEALVYAGKKDEAKAQFSRAAQLDLTPFEKAELQKYSANRV